MTEEERRKLKLYCFERQIVANQIFAVDFIEKVKKAFSDVPKPNLEFFAGSPEHNKECEECREVNDFFIGKRWEDCIDNHASGKVFGAQSFFKDLVWQYFLPAYFIQIITHSRFYIDYEFLEFIDKDHDLPELVKRQKERINLLTSKQCELIIGFCEIVIKVWQSIDEYREADAKNALMFWKENYQKAILREQNFNE